MGSPGPGAGQGRLFELGWPGVAFRLQTISGDLSSVSSGVAARCQKRARIMRAVMRAVMRGPSIFRPESHSRGCYQRIGVN
jgi:hypothetical protein